MKNVKTFEQHQENLNTSDAGSSKINEFFGDSLSDGEVNIKIDGDDDEGKKIIVDEIQKILNNVGGIFNLYLDGNKIPSRKGNN
jgi:hypothetical protein